MSNIPGEELKTYSLLPPVLLPREMQKVKATMHPILFFNRSLLPARGLFVDLRSLEGSDPLALPGWPNLFIHLDSRLPHPTLQVLSSHLVHLKRVFSTKVYLVQSVKAIATVLVTSTRNLYEDN